MYLDFFINVIIIINIILFCNIVYSFLLRICSENGINKNANKTHLLQHDFKIREIIEPQITNCVTIKF